jgi:TPR repeat protein
MKTRRFLVVVMVLFASAVPLRADDQATSVDSIRERAAQGEAAAQTILGAMYHEGQSVPQNYAEAFKWYRRAAAQGKAAAQFNVGFCTPKEMAARKMMSKPTNGSPLRRQPTPKNNSVTGQYKRVTA